MNCCIECFTDSQIREIIHSQGRLGNCDFCGQQNIGVYQIGENDGIEELIESVLAIYRGSPSVTEGKMLIDALREDWNIFTASDDIVLSLLIAICPVRFKNNEKLISEPVYIPECLDEDYLSEYGITRGYSWNKFAETIKYENRFHSHIFNQDAFASFLSFAAKSYSAGTLMYRARISRDKQGFDKDKMGAPPKELRTAGRINPEGVGVLYLSSKSETALYEARSSIYDFITVGEFILKRNITIVNLTGLNSISPFIYAGTNELQQYAVNQLCLQEFAAEISKPLRRSDSHLEYLPTQFISEYIKSQRYDGVEYASTMTTDGYNLAVFDETLFECIGTKVYEITEMSYSPKEIKF